MKNVQEIKKEYKKALTEKDIFEFIKEYFPDSRKAVQQLVTSAKGKAEKIKAENERLAQMCKIENMYYQKGAKYIAGMDEVGRGPFAGPVLTAAVILPKGFTYSGINDSKKLSAKKREELYKVIEKNAVAISVSLESNTVIDEIGILNATKKSMSKTVNTLAVRPDIVLVDAVTVPNTDIKQEAVIKGDEKSISIAAASIIAKVTRDKLMKDYAQLYPQYGFDENSGYGTAKHREAIKKYGLCPIHRKTFIH